MSYTNNPYATGNPYGQAYASHQPQQAAAVAGPSYVGTSGSTAGPTLPSGYIPSQQPYAYGDGYMDPYAGAGAGGGGYPSSYDAELAAQQSIYTPEAAKRVQQQQQQQPRQTQTGKARTTVLRKGGGQIWEDQSLMEWDPSHFRLFIGDLDPALSDDQFRQAFSGVRYPSFVKSKIVRDKYTNKGKGYGFVSYSDPEDFLKAWKEMNGKYVGTRPVKISKATAGVQAVNIGNKKAAALDAKRKQKTGTTPYERANLAESEGGTGAAAGARRYDNNGAERPGKKSWGIRR